MVKPFVMSRGTIETESTNVTTSGYDHGGLIAEYKRTAKLISNSFKGSNSFKFFSEEEFTLKEKYIAYKLKTKIPQDWKNKFGMDYFYLK